MLGDGGGCPQRRAEIQARLPAESQPFLRLSEPSLHIIHPVATSLRARRQAKQHVAVMISNGVEGGTVLPPCHCECDHVRGHGYRLPAKHLEVEHHVDELICSSALVRRRPSCRAALHVSLGAMTLGSCADTSTATRRAPVFLVDVHGCFFGVDGVDGRGKSASPVGGESQPDRFTMVRRSSFNVVGTAGDRPRKTMGLPSTPIHTSKEQCNGQCR